MADITPEQFLAGWYSFAKDKLGYPRTQAEWIEERKRGCIDLFWLAKTCLKLDLVDSYVCPQHPIMMGPEPEPCKICGTMFEPCPGLTSGISVHREICDSFVHKNPSETIYNQDTKKTRAIFCPRNSYKSTIDRADCIQWLLCFPDVRVLIFSATPSLGTEFVASIKTWLTLAKMEIDEKKGVEEYLCDPEFELFQQLYPEHLIGPGHRESEDQFTTPARKRPHYLKIKRYVEPSIFTLPLEGNTAGKHADVGKFDDCVSDGNSGPRASEENRVKVRQNILLKRKIIIPGGYVDYVGTPYDEADAYAHILEYRKPEVVLTRPAWEPKPHAMTKRAEELSVDDVNLLLPRDGKNAPLLTYEFLKAELTEGEFQFNCQYLCRPQTAKEEIKFSEFVINAHTISTEGFPEPGTYTIVSMWDCASSANKGSDFSVGGVGFFCVAGAHVGRMFVADIVRGKFNRFELPHQIAKLAAKWRVSRIIIEKSPGADFMENDIMRELVVCGYQDCPPPEWLVVDNNKDAKALRIEELASLMEQDRLYFGSEINIMHVVKDELMNFKPKSRKKDDTADMLGLLARQLPRNIELPKNEQERQSAAEDWLKQKFKHDLIYDPDFVKNLPGILQKPTPETPFETPKEWEGHPVINGPQDLYGT
jgi:phage terminase large subunit-like protein